MRAGHRDHLLAAVAWLLMVSGGCFYCKEPPAPAAEPSFATQLDALCAGDSDRMVLLATRIDDEQMAQLAGAENDATGGRAIERLRHLELGQGHLTDRGASELSIASSLEVLVVESSEITDRGLAELAKLRQLRRLNLGGSQVTDAGLEQLAALEQLELLRLGSEQITDAGMPAIAGIESLRFLILRAPRLTDAGLTPLARLQHLESLYLQGAGVSDQGIAELQRLRPDLHIHW